MIPLDSNFQATLLLCNFSSFRGVELVLRVATVIFCLLVGGKKDIIDSVFDMFSLYLMVARAVLSQERVNFENVGEG